MEKRENPATVVWEWFVGLAGIACMARLFIGPTTLKMAVIGLGVVVSAIAYLLLTEAMDHLKWWQRGDGHGYLVLESESDYQILRVAACFFFVVLLALFTLLESIRLYYVLIGQ
jgi:hypothetical protein